MPMHACVRVSLRIFCSLSQLYYTAPTPPKNVRFDSLTAKTVRIEWDAPAYVNGTIDSYLVNFHNSTNKTSLTAKSGSTSITFMHLRPYTNHNVTVRAYANATTKSRRDTLVHYFFKGQRSDAVYASQLIRHVSCVMVMN